MSAMVIFEGHVSGEAENAQHALPMNAITILFTARCYASTVLAMSLCPSVCVCLSQADVLLKRQNVKSHKQQNTIPQGV